MREELIKVLEESAAQWNENADNKANSGNGIAAGELRENAEKLYELIRLIRGF